MASMPIFRPTKCCRQMSSEIIFKSLNINSPQVPRRIFLKNISLQLFQDHLKIRSQLKNLPRSLHDLIILHCKKAESPEVSYIYFIKLFKMINIIIFCLPQIEMSVESELKKRKRCYVCPSTKGSMTQIICYKCRRHICQRHSSNICKDCEKYPSATFNSSLFSDAVIRSARASATPVVRLRPWSTSSSLSYHLDLPLSLVVPVRESHHAPTTTTAQHIPHRQHAEDDGGWRPDALTNMQPHCEDLVSRLTDAIRGIAVSRVEEALISPFDGSYAASNFIQQLERTSEGPQDDATLQTRLRTLLKGEPLSLYNELNLASLPYSQAKQTLIDLYPGKSEVTFTKFLTFKLTNQIQLGEYYRQKITMGLQLGLTKEGLQASDQRLVRAIAPKTLTEWYSTMTRIKGTSSLPTPSEPFQGVSNTSAFHRDTGTPSRGRNYNPFSTNNTPRYPSGARRPPSPCKYCQGNQWNNECSMNRRPYRQQAYHGQPTAHYFPPEQNGAHNLPVPAPRSSRTPQGNENSSFRP
ncbi:hypothetical protein LAZ67_21000041 [Cordylochernes scorpioides]|uniref:Gag protein n=1 Tax=Cordylochernes scorpioides TaxID=51811 RepID=A0ABY6LL53_9ARAC|nr:hypothetical protein LAZ67_21000041 [Cordylochernes scorpioides]